MLLTNIFVNKHMLKVFKLNSFKSNAVSNIFHLPNRIHFSVNGNVVKLANNASAD